jgi:hypothetical protein
MKNFIKVGALVFGIIAVSMVFTGGRAAARALPPVNVGVPLPADWSDYQWEYQHVVKQGEYLYMLAGYFYEDGHKWNWIFEANRNVIENPNLIYPGQLITVRVKRGWEPPKHLSLGEWNDVVGEHYQSTGPGAKPKTPEQPLPGEIR